MFKATLSPLLLPTTMAQVGGESINTFSMNCLNDPDQIQDSGGAAVVLNLSLHSDAEN